MTEASNSKASPGVAELKLEDPKQADVRLLVEELDAEMGETTDTSNCALSSVEELDQDYAHFLVARFHGHPIACGALVVKDIDWAEVKRVYVRPVVRGKGLSKAIMNALIDMAKGQGLTRLKLETTTDQSAAVALYRGLGFQACAAYEDHQDESADRSLFMELMI